MVKSYGSRTSRVLDLDAKSLQLLVARSGKAITDAEGVFLQDLQAAKLAQFANTQTFSGCVDLPHFRLPVAADGLSPNCLIIPAFRALIGSNLVFVQGTNNPDAPLNLDNHIYFPENPATGHGIVIVYLEAWYQLLDEVLGDTPNHGFFPNYPPSTWNALTDPRYYFPYGNTQAHTNWIQNAQFLDDLKDPIAGYTSGRVQLQYALRAVPVKPSLSGSMVPQLTDYLKDFGLTHPNVSGMTFYKSDTPYPFVFQGAKDPGLYVSTGAKLRTVDSCSYAIPLAVVYQRNTGVWNPMTNAHGVATPSLLSTVSGRPDGKLANILYPNDIIDTRSSFMGGSLEDYKSTIEKAASRLWRGMLRLKLAEPTDTDPTAHQLGQTLLSQEYLGQTATVPYSIQDPIPCISSNSVPQMSWTADSYEDTLTYQVTPINKDITTGVMNYTQWLAGDTVTLTHPSLSTVYESASIFTFNNLSNIFKIPPAYISVAGLGSNSLKLTFFNIGVDSRITLSSPIWVVVTFKKPKSIDHFRYVPTQVHPPLLLNNGVALPCGSISDFSMGYEDTVLASHLVRSYKRNFGTNTFGTVRRVRATTQELIQRQATELTGTPGQLQVSFQAMAQTASTQTVLLTWTVSNATRATLVNTTTGVPIGDVPLSGSMSVRITQQCTFVLTAYNDISNASQVSSVVVSPPTELVSGSAYTDDGLTKIYAAPGGSLNPENTLVNYTIFSPPMLSGIGDKPMIGCIKATLYRAGLDGSFEETELQLRHQYYTPSSGQFEIGFFGWYEPNGTDYVEFEVLIAGMKTFHYNATVQGITGITETVLQVQKSYLPFITSPASEPYTFTTTADYTQAAMNIIVSVPTKTWVTDARNYQLGGVFEGIFGFNGQGYVFVKQTGDAYYRTTPCVYSGLGTPMLHLVLPQITLANIDDILVLAQATTSLGQASTVLFNYEYVPYQGEGSTSDSYTLAYLDPEVKVTTFGTGSRSIPGLTSTASTNPELPASSVLPAGPGWTDADLESDKFMVGGVFSGLNNPAYSNTEFLSTKILTTVTGNVRNLLDEAPALNPRGASQRGFIKNTVAFSYIIDPPKIISSPHTLNSSTQSELVYWVDTQLGDDDYSGMSRDVPKKSLQNLLNSLPEIIKHKVTIYFSGNVVLSQQNSPSLNVTQVAPYGKPEVTGVYSLVRSSFNTIGEGVVRVCQNPFISSVANIETLAAAPIGDSPVYGWLHLGGKLELDGLVFNSTAGISLAAYPESHVSLTNCGFIGGEIQVLGYNSDISLVSTSFSNPTHHSVIVSNRSSLMIGENVTLVKGPADGYSVVVEKGSTATIMTDTIACSTFPAVHGVEFLVSSYSTIDTHFSPSFTFGAGLLKLQDYSTLIYNTTLPFGSPVGDPQDYKIINQTS